MSDLDRQVAADPRHPCSETMRRALRAEKQLRKAEEALRLVQQAATWTQVLSVPRAYFDEEKGET